MRLRTAFQRSSQAHRDLHTPHSRAAHCRFGRTLTEMKLAWHSLAIALASSVLPQPGQRGRGGGEGGVGDSSGLGGARHMVMPCRGQAAHCPHSQPAGGVQAQPAGLAERTATVPTVALQVQ